MLLSIASETKSAASAGEQERQPLPTRKLDPRGLDQREPQEQYARCNFVAIAPQEPGGATT